MDTEPNLVSAMQVLEVSRSFERLKDALLQGHSQCDSWEKAEIGARGRRANPKFTRYLDTTKDDYTSQWSFAGENRCVFREEKAYLGLGLKTVRAGDRIYLLQGAPVPYVFRHQPVDPDSVLDFKGEVYVHGIIYGEVVETGSLARHCSGLKRNAEFGKVLFGDL